MVGVLKLSGGGREGERGEGFGFSVRCEWWVEEGPLDVHLFNIFTSYVLAKQIYK